MRQTVFLTDCENLHHQIGPGDTRRDRSAGVPLEPGDRPTIREKSPCTLERFPKGRIPLREDEPVDAEETGIATLARSSSLENRTGRPVYVSGEARHVYDRDVLEDVVQNSHHRRGSLTRNGSTCAPSGPRLPGQSAFAGSSAAALQRRRGG